MEQDTHETLVIFRAEKHGQFKGMVTAILPDCEATPGRVAVFDAQSGHGEGSREWWRNRTRPATPEEYAETARVMVKNYGYRLRVRKRNNRGR